MSIESSWPAATVDVAGFEPHAAARRRRAGEPSAAGSTGSASGVVSTMRSSSSTSTCLTVSPPRTTLSLAPISSIAGAVQVGVEVAGVEAERLAGRQADEVQQQRDGDARIVGIALGEAAAPSRPRRDRSSAQASTTGCGVDRAACRAPSTHAARTRRPPARPRQRWRVELVRGAPPSRRPGGCRTTPRTG